MLPLLGALLLALTAAVPASAYPGPGHVTGDVLVHDPTMIRTADGYVLYSTHGGLEARTSTDRVHFRRAGSAFATPPSWWRTYSPTSDVWAPDISHHDGRYLMYYAVSSFGSNRSAIGLATSTTGRPGSWTDQGVVYTTSTSSDHNAIDPSLLVDADGRWWLSFGSYWSGIHAIRIDPASGKRAAWDTTRRHLATRPASPHAVEAPHIIRHGSFYYLFVSFDRCCAGTSSTYKIMVGRSTEPTGPFRDRNGTPMVNGGGTPLLETHGRVIGPGGQSVLHDTDGDLLVYHYYDGEDRGTAKLGVNLLGWDAAGWPYAY
ncbi:arabinan endo-1,5-alpha-L-arabinosidase [Streptomyces sp. TRM 70351]|nr:arabinan endo-1,5-alpha-L-arabinosidase [Streptomyces sp. TRM 70351]MEE1930795.1 arabinan endo-1,5-alpha-L-arabinosidase [Streptomyces sp. TRM 70351]